MNSCIWIQSIYIWIHILMNSCTNSEFGIQNLYIYINSYTWIHILINSMIISYMNSLAYEWSYEFIWTLNSYDHKWTSEFIKTMNSYDHFMYKFIYINSCMNSCKLWICMIMSYMKSYGSSNMNSGVPRLQMPAAPGPMLPDTAAQRIS